MLLLPEETNEFSMWRHWQLLSVVCRCGLCCSEFLQKYALVKHANCMVNISEYDVSVGSQITGLDRKSTDSPGHFCKTGQFAMFEALYLRLLHDAWIFLCFHKALFPVFSRSAIFSHESAITNPRNAILKKKLAWFLLWAKTVSGGANCSIPTLKPGNF